MKPSACRGLESIILVMFDSSDVIRSSLADNGVRGCERARLSSSSMLTVFMNETTGSLTSSAVASVGFFFPPVSRVLLFPLVPLWFRAVLLAHPSSRQHSD